MHVFIGHDSRQHEAYMACAQSLTDSLGEGELDIHPIEHRALRDMGMFRRPWCIAEDGQYIDLVDEKPFSTEFSHTRFLTPHMADAAGIADQWVLFCDSDFVFFQDVSKLFALADSKYAVMVVKHQFKSENATKMDGMIQEAYPKKLWSSLILWNRAHPSNQALTVQSVNTASGRELHGFAWLKEEEIGELPGEWNWIPGHSSLGSKVYACHWSFGGPWMEGYENEHFAEQWRALYVRAVKSHYEAITGGPPEDEEETPDLDGS